MTLKLTQKLHSARSRGKEWGSAPGRFKGCVVQRKRKSGTVYIGRYRVRNAGKQTGWEEKSFTLRDCKTMKAAQKGLDRILDDLNRGDGVLEEPERVPFDHVLDRLWPNHLDTQGVKPSTRRSYSVMVAKWIKPFFSGKLLNDITPIAIGDFMASLKNKELSQQYRLNIYSVLRVIFELAVDYKLLPASPIRSKIHRPKVDRGEKSVWTADQAAAVIQAVPPDFHAAIATVAVTGLRASELIGLQWRDVDLARSTIKVQRGGVRRQVDTTKTRSSRALIRIPEPLVGILEAHRKQTRFDGPKDFVFAEPDGRPITCDKLRRRAIYPALDKLGIPRVKRESGVHAFRHLAGSVAHEETRSLKYAQQFLRHSNISTTANIYVHTPQEEMAEVAEILGNVLLENSCGTSVVQNGLATETVQ